MAEHTQVEQIFAAIFKRAKDEDVEVPCQDSRTADTMRFRMYAFARKVKAKPRGQEELIAAMEAVSLTVEGTMLVARGKLKYAGMQSALEAMGGMEGVAKWLGKSEQDLEVEASQKRMADLLKPKEADASGEAADDDDTATAIKRDKTPYY